MKNLLPILLLLLATTFLNAQKTINQSIKNVSKMAILPGCEKFTDNTDLQKCIAKNINEQLRAVLDPQADYFTNFRMKEIASKLQFVITKQGKIINIEHIEGNQLLSEKAISAFENYAKEITVQPASIEDGSLVNLVLQLPVKYRLSLIWDNEQKIFNKSNSKELTYLTIQDEDSLYEIRLKKDFSFSIYLLNNENYEFLGNVMNWLEFSSMEPFSKYVNRLAVKQWELITSGNLDGENYNVYRWGYDLEYVRVYKVINGEENLVFESNRFKKFLKSPFLKLLYRN